ncbi:hypothetical protein KP509_23G060400 [Ceratopteris richardii]|uniref:RWD domain-containing protein n=1 Tax=Ceratopteris richardii TaxID=49495 RepID=A0A8T2S2I8_CERRI|nr:hypothetical protein KP509_23G060400 [Ceratopteris richardii]
MDEVEEEAMALESIFYDSFTKIDSNRFRVRIDPQHEEDSSGHSSQDVPPFFVEMFLPPSYPQAIPVFDVSNINNNAYTDFAKKAIVLGLQNEASSLIGESMCYAILEWLRDKLPEFYSMKPISTDEDSKGLDSGHPCHDKELNTVKKDVKEKMSKAQKRRYFDKFGAAAEKPRGWDWVSIISHLSQVPQHGAQ